MRIGIIVGPGGFDNAHSRYQDKMPLILGRDEGGTRAEWSQIRFERAMYRRRQYTAGQRDGTELQLEEQSAVGDALEQR